MKKTSVIIPILIMLSLFCSLAFGASAGDRLKGKWTCDGAASAKLMDGQFANMQERQSAADILGGMSIIFNPVLKTMKVTLGLKTQDSKYKVLSESGKGLTLERESDSAKLMIEFKDNNTLVLRDKGMSMVFKRAR